MCTDPEIQVVNNQTQQLLTYLGGLDAPTPSLHKLDIGKRKVDDKNNVLPVSNSLRGLLPNQSRSEITGLNRMCNSRLSFLALFFKDLSDWRDMDWNRYHRQAYYYKMLL
jgi:hypothetical protein